MREKIHKIKESITEVKFQEVQYPKSRNTMLKKHLLSWDQRKKALYQIQAIV